MVTCFGCLQRLIILVLLSPKVTVFGFSPVSHLSIAQVKRSELKMIDDNNLIMVVGSANQDLTSNTDIIPTIGETVMGQDFSTACGGKGANQAVAAASLQLAPVAMTCRVGDDLFGQNLLSNFRKFWKGSLHDAI
jgi:hypothetical protein